MHAWHPHDPCVSRVRCLQNQRPTLGFGLAAGARAPCMLRRLPSSVPTPRFVRVGLSFPITFKPPSLGPLSPPNQGNSPSLRRRQARAAASGLPRGRGESTIHTFTARCIHTLAYIDAVRNRYRPSSASQSHHAGRIFMDGLGSYGLDHHPSDGRSSRTRARAGRCGRRLLTYLRCCRHVQGTHCPTCGGVKPFGLLVGRPLGSG
ncbi:hypothetical protein R3P38DRAFT_619298 [Favolaschia claudopus]|uniref:Uncharacterized protein n=1 Tax=Favolaschia claudopus TaxID=2862362 RepID=A0AAW0CDS7_9AGAR